MSNISLTPARWRLAAPALVLGAVLLACSAGASPEPTGASLGDIQGIEWRAVSVADKPPVPRHVPTITFTGSGIAGNAGCNSYGGDVVIAGSAIEVRQLIQTEMACVDAMAMDIESAFVGALASARQIELRGEQLVISGPEGELVFERAG